jgi:hypothetical protein
LGVTFTPNFCPIRATVLIALVRFDFRFGMAGFLAHNEREDGARHAGRSDCSTDDSGSAGLDTSTPVTL